MHRTITASAHCTDVSSPFTGGWLPMQAGGPSAPGPSVYCWARRMQCVGGRRLPASWRGFRWPATRVALYKYVLAYACSGWSRASLTSCVRQSCTAVAAQPPLAVSSGNYIQADSYQIANVYAFWSRAFVESSVGRISPSKCTCICLHPSVYAC